MKIVRVTPHPVAVGAGADEPRSLLFVTVETDDGLIGIGEAADGDGCRFAGLLATVVREALAPIIVGEDAAGIDPLVRRLRTSTRRRLGDQWLVMQAIAAIEVALWDLAGKARGTSVADLLGTFRQDVDVYVTGAALAAGDPSWHLGRLHPYLARGVRHVQFDLGSDHDADLATLTDIRARLPADVDISIDGGELFTVPTALRIAALLAELDVVWFAEPVPQHHRRAIRTVAARAPVPIAYGAHIFGMHDAQSLLDLAMVEVLQPDASIGAGLAESRRVAAVAEHAGARVVAHSAAGPVALAANLHVAATSANVALVQYDTRWADEWPSIAPGNGFAIDDIVDGRLRVPAGPGLGVVIEPDLLPGSGAEHGPSGGHIPPQISGRPGG